MFKLFNFHSNLHVIKRDSVLSMVSCLISCHPNHASLTLTCLPTCLFCSALASYHILCETDCLGILVVSCSH